MVDELGTAREIADAIRRRDVSPREIMAQTIARIEQRNPSLNGLVLPYFDQAMAAASAAESRIMAGERLRLLEGVPVVMKDCLDFKPGWISTYGGVPALKDNLAEGYCTFASRMEDAGAIIVGKTNSPVFGFRGTCDNKLFGPTRNPFDLSRNSGGSSGGSAAMVADGLITIAEGTDGGGSIRIPAAWCNVFGFKPSFGRVPIVSRPNAFGAIAPFDFEGPITRTVADAALAMNCLAGADDADPFSIETRFDFAEDLSKPPTGWRIGYTRDFGVFAVEPEVITVTDSAVRVFSALGATVELVDPAIGRSEEELSSLWCRMIGHGMIELLAQLKEATGFDFTGLHRQDIPEECHIWMEQARMEGMNGYQAGQSMRTEIYDALEAVLGSHDLIVSPTMACLPVPNATDGNTLGPASIAGRPINRLIGFCMTFFANFTGHPAASIPAGLSNGLPVGLQLIGRRQRDLDVFRASAAFERARPWQEHYAICAERKLD